MNASVDTLLRSLQLGLAEVLASQPVVLAYLYGSEATGKTTPFSDVDIALVVDENSVPTSERLRFELALEEEIARRCGLSEADVRVINDAPLMLRGQVVTDGLLLFARDEATRVEFETRTRMEYLDFLPTAGQLREAFFARIRERGLHGQPEQSRGIARQPDPVR